MKRYYPEQFNVITSADDAGAIIDLQRIPGEDLATYRKRVIESSERVANSSYEGLINGINRELGLDRTEVFSIDLKSKLNGNTNNPVIHVAGDTIIDERAYSGNIDGVMVKAIGNKISTDRHIFNSDELVGLSFVLNSVPYLIIKNTTNEIYLKNADISGATGQTYLIKPLFKSDEFMGMTLQLDGKKYTIQENTSNTIKVDRAIKINDSTLYSIKANRPRIQITASSMILYREYLNEDNFKLDMDISLREANLSHKDIVKMINAQSDFFIATDLIPLKPAVPAFTIKKQDSDVRVFREVVPGTKYFKLKNKNIQEGTLKFSETGVFLREVPDIELEQAGPFYSSDNAQGIIRSKFVPSGKGVVSYTYMNIPFKVESVPAIVTSFADKDAESFLFAQKEKIMYDDPRDKHISSQPKGKMIEYISELLSINNQTWGE